MVGEIRTRRELCALSETANRKACYFGYRQSLLPERLSVAYIFSRKSPKMGGTLTNTETGERYRVKNVIPLQSGEVVDCFEVVLGHS